MSFMRRLFFALSYFRRPRWDSGISPPELLAFLKDRPAGRAIDLGCGTGTNVITLAKLGWQVMGVDFVPSAIAQARKKAKQAGVSADLQVDDVTRLEGMRRPFDFALDLGCFHGLGLAEKGDYLRRLDEILAPGGHWLVYGFLGQSPPNLSDADLERIQTRFRQISRQDGSFRGKDSAYFLYQK